MAEVVGVYVVVSRRCTIIIPPVAVEKGLGYRDGVFDAVDSDWWPDIDGRESCEFVFKDLQFGGNPERRVIRLDSYCDADVRQPCVK